jgi:hypothetical protein
LLPIPGPVAEKESADLGVVNCRSIDAAKGLFNAIPFLIDAPGCEVLSAHWCPQLFLCILRDALAFQRTLEHKTENLRIATGVFESCAWCAFWFEPKNLVADIPAIVKAGGVPERVVVILVEADAGRLLQEVTNGNSIEATPFPLWNKIDNGLFYGTDKSLRDGTANEY